MSICNNYWKVMNIRLVISNYKNKDGKSKVCLIVVNTYRKKINTGVEFKI